MSVPPVPHRVVLHIGAPKSGTTFIQRALWRHHTTLRERGFLCPGKAARDMFHAAIDVRGTYETWGFEREALAGTWTRLCREAREFPGTSILSHELLAAATEEQVAAALAELDGLDVHVVFTARDLGRQVVSEWQERIKNGSTVSFAEFEKRVARRIATQRFDSLFWRHQHLPAALARWTSDLPPGNVHVVVAPRAGADPGVLWRRFGEAVGFDAESLDPTDPGGRANQTLGIVSIAILRQVNDALQGRIVQPGYARVVKRFLGQDLLARHESLRPSSPPGLRATLRELTQEWLREIDARGYRVHGDLAELLPEEPAAPVPAPDEVDPREQADVSAAVIADLLVEVAELRGEVQEMARAERVAARQARRLRGRVRRRTGRLARSLLRR